MTCVTKQLLTGSNGWFIHTVEKSETLRFRSGVRDGGDQTNHGNGEEEIPMDTLDL